MTTPSDDRSLAPLDETTLAAACAALAARDADLAQILSERGVPPLWSRAPGFATLVHIILEQQVSLASAKAAMDRLLAAGGGGITPAWLLTLDDTTMRAIGFSRQKLRYAREMSATILDGRFDPDALAALDDDAARAALTSLLGIGSWTADVYLLMALGRPDVWPAGDLALQEAARGVKRLPARPGPTELTALAEPWRPHRAAAARLLWQEYLATR